MKKKRMLWVLILALLIVPSATFAKSKKNNGWGNSGNYGWNSYSTPWYNPPYERYQYKLRVFPNGDYTWSTPGADYLPYISSGSEWRTY